MLQSIIDILNGDAVNDTARQRFENNLLARLQVDIAEDTTAILYEAVTGNWPALLDEGQWFAATLSDATGRVEIIKVTATSPTTLTAVRGFDSSGAQVWTAAGTQVSARLNAGSITQSGRKDELNTWAQVQEFVAGFFARGDGRFESGLSIGPAEVPEAEFVRDAGTVLLTGSVPLVMQFPDIIINGLLWPPSGGGGGGGEDMDLGEA